MRVAVLGGGVVGVTTAWCLARDGHEVTLHERRDALATEASWGNAGLISPSDAYAWASPAALRMAVRSLWQRDLGISYKLRLDPRLWLWSLQFLPQCTRAAAERNTRIKFRLLRYSLQEHNVIAAEARVTYDGLAGGILYYFRSESGLREGARHASLLQDLGLAIEVLDRDAMLRIEPAMRQAPEVCGALYSPTCQTGNSNAFATGLAEAAQKRHGLQVRLGQNISRLVRNGDRVIRAETASGPVEADVFVLAAGAESVFLAESIGLRLPIYPVKGFSVTLPIRDASRIPARAIVDEDKLIAMTPMGRNLRISASAVFTGFDRSHRPEDFAGIRRLADALFGDAVDWQQAVYWTGFRPMTPASVPILGASPLKNLVLNVGHGHVGWSMCSGSARIVTDVIAGRQPGIDLAGLTLG